MVARKVYRIDEISPQSLINFPVRKKIFLYLKKNSYACSKTIGESLGFNYKSGDFQYHLDILRREGIIVREELDRKRRGTKYMYRLSNKYTNLDVN